MQAKETYSDVYEQLLHAKDLQPLPKFKSSRSGLLLYPDAQKIPQFFKNNLLRSGRVIKVVKGKSALLRGFIYQLMKLTFQIQADNKVNYVQVLKAIVFHPQFLQEEGEMLSPISGRGCNDRQYKRIIADFIEMMQSQSIPNLELTIMEYPIVDEALTRTLETYTTRFYHNDSNTLHTLQWLCQTFAVTLQVYGKCYHFKEPDIFLYEEDTNQFYLAYVNEMAEVSDYSESTYRFEDIKNLNDRSRKPKDWESSIPDKIQQDQELELRMEDRFRNSAEPVGRRISKEERQNRENTRKTFGNSQTMRELAKEVDQSIHQKPSDPSKSKIGSLIEIMSDKSREELAMQHRTPQISSSRQFSEEERRSLEPLTTRTAELDFKSQLEQIMQEKHLSNLEQEQMTPQFTTNAHLVQEEYYNPFTKKYSDLYMGHMYSNHMHFDQAYGKEDFKFYQTQQHQKQYQPEFKLEDSPIYGTFHNYAANTPIYTSNTPNYTSNTPNYTSNTPNYTSNTPNYTSSSPNYGSSFTPSLNLSSYQINVKPQNHLHKQQFTSYYDYKTETPSYLPSYQSSFSDIFSKKTQEKDDEDLIYRPKGKSKIVIQGDQEQIRGVQDSKGTIYRQFTDTKVLAIMTSFQKMRTNTIRQRFRGVRHRDLLGR